MQGKERYRISRDIHNDKDIVEFNFVEKYYHKFDIKDAKDGDVLATLDYILIFKEFLKNDGGISYCHYDFGAGNPQFIWSEDKNWYFGKEAIIHPATKEQRDTLMKAMADAGYTFDFEKKELKKIEQKQVIDYPDNLPKDNELTWEDMRELYIIFAEVDVEIELCKTDIQAETIGYYQEVLKRFKAQKGE